MNSLWCWSPRVITEIVIDSMPVICTWAAVEKVLHRLYQARSYFSFIKPEPIDCGVFNTKRNTPCNLEFTCSCKDTPKHHFLTGKHFRQRVRSSVQFTRKIKVYDIHKDTPEHMSIINVSVHVLISSTLYGNLKQTLLALMQGIAT